MSGSSVAFTYDSGESGDGLPSNVRALIVDWVSDSATGAASATTRKISGMLLKAVTIPGSGGVAPTDNYDISITDENSVDVLGHCKTSLANRDTATTEVVDLMLLNEDSTALSTGRGPVVCNPLTIAIANAGNSKSGKLILYYTP